VGRDPQERQALLPPIQAGTLDPAGILTTMAPQEATDASVLRWWRGFLQSAISPAEADEELRSLDPVDIRGLLGSVQAPVLVLQSSRWSRSS
jgi:hypothetical protein